MDTPFVIDYISIILLPILEFPDQANPKVESAKC